MLLNRLRAPGAAGLAVLAAVLAPLTPNVGRAECIGAWTPMPSFTTVAETARRIVVGTVIEDLDQQPGEEESGGVLWSYVLRVDAVLRGPDPGPTVVIDDVPTRAPITGKCGGRPRIYARMGDQIAVAFGGRLPGLHRRGNAAAWIIGSPDALAAPKAEVLTFAEVERAAAVLPDTSTVSETPPHIRVPVWGLLMAAVPMPIIGALIEALARALPIPAEGLRWR